LAAAWIAARTCWNVPQRQMLVIATPKPTDADIDGAITNICRCGTFQQVRAAIHAAAKA